MGSLIGDRVPEPLEKGGDDRKYLHFMAISDFEAETAAGLYAPFRYSD
jgi:hypothetical protein